MSVNKESRDKDISSGFYKNVQIFGIYQLPHTFTISRHLHYIIVDKNELSDIGPPYDRHVPYCCSRNPENTTQFVTINLGCNRVGTEENQFDAV